MRRLIAAFTLIFFTALAVDAYPGLRGGAGWRWPYEVPQHVVAVVVLALVVAVYIGGVVLLRRWQAGAAIIVAWAVIGGTTMGFAVVGIQSGDALFTLFTRTVSPVQTGASTIAVHTMAQEGVSSTLERWPQIMDGALQTNIIHFTTSPPGQPLIHFVAARLVDNLPGVHDLSMALRQYQCSNPNVMFYNDAELVSVALVGMLMPLWAALAVIPLYFSAVHLGVGKSAALRLASWWPLVPAVLLFLPTWNTLYPALSVLAFALLLAGSRQSGWRMAALLVGAGIIMSVATFLNFAVMPVLLLFGLYTLGTCLLIEGGLRRAVLIGLWFGVGLISVWMAYWLVTGLTPFDLAVVTADQHSQLVANRPYLAWLILHPYDVLMFIGWPLAGLFVWAVWRAVRTRIKGQPVSAAGVLAVALLVTFLAVDVAGVVQGENARIMSFYAPFLLLSAGRLFKRGKKWDVPLLVTQGMTVLVMAAMLPVVPLDLNPPPDAPRTDVPRLDMLEPQPVNARFHSDKYAGSFVLEGHRFIPDLGAQVITLETIWRGREQVERPYQFQVVARAENAIDGEIVTEPHIWRAQNGNYLPTCWQSDDVIHDVVLLEMPPVSAPVVWTLELRAVDPRTGDVMQVTQADGTAADHALLGPVNYP